MRHTVSIIIILLFAQVNFAQTAKIVQLDHSLRWLSEKNFPNYLDEPEVEEKIIFRIDSALKQKIEVEQIEFPAHFKYKLISFTGKSKIKMPKSKGDDYMIAFSSGITRGTTNMRVFWNMKIEIQQGKQVIFANEIEHELEPYSVSIRLGNMPWYTKTEFLNAVTLLMEECFQLREFQNEPICFGSPEMVRQKVGEMMAIQNEYILAVSGKMMGQSKSSYKLLKDSLTISDFSYKPTNQLDINFSLSGSQILADIFKDITGIDSYYTLKSKEKRTGAIYGHEGIRRKVRLDWLEEIEQSTDEDDEILSRIISPVTGAYLDKDSLIAQFIFYQEIQKVPKNNMQALHDAQFQMGNDDLVESLYSIIGNFNGNKFEVTYREFDQLIFIRVQDELIAILSLVNINPESRSSRGIRLSKNMVSTTSSEKFN